MRRLQCGGTSGIRTPGSDDIPTFSRMLECCFCVDLEPAEVVASEENEYRE